MDQLIPLFDGNYPSQELQYIQSSHLLIFLQAEIFLHDQLGISLYLSSLITLHNYTQLMI